MSWKEIAKSSSLNEAKPISCFSLDIEYKAGKWTVLSHCIRNCRTKFKTAASSFIEADTSSSRMNLC